MASRPIRAQLLQDIAALPDGWESLWERVADGETQTTIARSFGVTQGFLSRIIHEDPEHVKAFEMAKRQAADGYADEVKDIADNLLAERDHIAKGRERIAARRWLAGVHNREKYGEPSAVSVGISVNVASLHVDALRHRVVEASHSVVAAGAAEIVPETASIAATGARNSEQPLTDDSIAAA